MIRIEEVIYGLVALMLVGTVGLVLFTIVTSFLSIFAGGELITGIIHIIDKILLTLMIAEILYTVIISFESHSLKCEPFLIVGLIASVRRVLLISLEAAHMSIGVPQQFNNFMIELGILSVLIFIFVISIYLLRKKQINDST
jgi:uncharacterized membrane protein (DUF373 family)